MRPPIVGDWVVPEIPANVPVVKPPHPWDGLVWPEGATMSLAAGQGLGKSSIAMMLNQGGEGFSIGAWITTEQDPYQVAAMSHRLGVKPPPIWTVAMAGDGAEVFASARAGLRKTLSGAGAVTVFDSLTPLGVQDAAKMMNMLIADARQTGRRVLMINQTNKANQVAGAAALMFMPDIDCRVIGSEFGRRKLVFTKNRYGATYTRYFDFDPDTGTVVRPDFSDVVHSVEGTNPEYALVSYGLAHGSIPGRPGQARGKTVQWAGILDVLADFGLLTKFSGYACAGFESLATPSGVQFPDDWKYRRRFAEQHGLKWLTEDMILEALVKAGWVHPAIRRVEEREQQEQGED